MSIATDPVRVLIEGRPHWQWADGLTFPVIAGGDGEEDDKKFTQDQVNTMLANERRRLLAEQPDLTDLRDKAKKYDDLVAQSQNEVDREKARADQAEKARDEAVANAKTIARRAAILAEAAAQNAVDPEAVHALLGDTSSVTVGDDGKVTGAVDAVKVLLTEKTYLVKAAEGDGSEGATGGGGGGDAGDKKNDGEGGKKLEPGGADGGAKNKSAKSEGQLTREDLKGMSSAEIVQAKADGRLDEALGRDQ